jgi:hypothetical protein
VGGLGENRRACERTQLTVGTIEYVVKIAALCDSLWLSHGRHCKGTVVNAMKNNIKWFPELLVNFLVNSPFFIPLNSKNLRTPIGEK